MGKSIWQILEKRLAEAPLPSAIRSGPKPGHGGGLTSLERVNTGDQEFDAATEKFLQVAHQRVDSMEGQDQIMGKDALAGLGRSLVRLKTLFEPKIKP